MANDLNMRELFDDIAIAGQQHSDVGPRSERPGKGGGNGGQLAHADEVVHFRRDKKDSQKTPSPPPNMLLCQHGSTIPRSKFSVAVGFFEALPWSAAAR